MSCLDSKRLIIRGAMNKVLLEVAAAEIQGGTVGVLHDSRGGLAFRNRRTVLLSLHLYIMPVDFRKMRDESLRMLFMKRTSQLAIFS